MIGNHQTDSDGAPTDAEILGALRRMTDDGFRYTELAIAARVSPATMRYTLATGLMPKQQRTRTALAAFVKLNGSARVRGDLRFVAAGGER